jgi:diacylglycerol kinase
MQNRKSTTFAGSVPANPPANPSVHPFHTNLGFIVGRWYSFQAALAGIQYTVRTQPNVWIELTAIAIVSTAGLWFRLSGIEWAILVLTFGVILALEAVNTAIETVVDLVSPQYHPLAKIAKDTAAGALLLAVLGSIGVAGFIFGPRLLQLFG